MTLNSRALSAFELLLGGLIAIGGASGAHGFIDIAGIVTVFFGWES